VLSWNQIRNWLRQIDTLTAACVAWADASGHSPSWLEPSGDVSSGVRVLVPTSVTLDFARVQSSHTDLSASDRDTIISVSWEEPP
jgi:hypothetical protein